MSTPFMIWLIVGAAGGFRLAREAKTFRAFCLQVIGCAALGPVAFLFVPKAD